MKRTTVVVDEGDLLEVKKAAKHQGRSEADLFREAFHLIALRNRRWDTNWAIPEIDLGEPLSQEQVDQSVRDGIADQ